jgi:hypothetical protein
MDEGDVNQQPSAPTGYGDAPQRSDIDEILRRKRKAREYKVRKHTPFARRAWKSVAKDMATPTIMLQSHANRANGTSDDS